MTDKETRRANEKLAADVLARIKPAVGETVDSQHRSRRFIRFNNLIRSIADEIIENGPSELVLERLTQLSKGLSDAHDEFNGNFNQSQRANGQDVSVLHGINLAAITNAGTLVANALAERVEAERVAKKDFADKIAVQLEQVTYCLEKINNFSPDDISFITTKSEKAYASLVEHGANDDARALLGNIARYLDSQDIELPDDNMMALSKAVKIVDDALEVQNVPEDKTKISFFKPDLSPRNLLGAAALAAAALVGTCHEIKNEIPPKPPAPEVQPPIDLKKPEADAHGAGAMEKATPKERGVPARK